MPTIATDIDRDTERDAVTGETVPPRSAFADAGHVQEAQAKAPAPVPVPATPSPPGAARYATLAEVERDHILRVFEALAGNVSAAARALGVSRATVGRKLKEYRAGGIGSAAFRGS